MAAQTQAAEESQHMREEVATVLREQLGIVQEGTAQRVDTVMQELTWWFEGAASHMQREVVTMQQTEITALREEISWLKLQQESFVHNVEAARTSSVTKCGALLLVSEAKWQWSMDTTKMNNG